MYGFRPFSLYTCRSYMACGTVPDLTVYTQIASQNSDLTDRSLGRQIFEDFRALRAQANFHSNFGKSPAAPSWRVLAVVTRHEVGTTRVLQPNALVFALLPPFCTGGSRTPCWRPSRPCAAHAARATQLRLYQCYPVWTLEHGGAWMASVCSHGEIFFS